MINERAERYCRNASCHNPRQTDCLAFVHFMDFVGREPLFAVCTITGATIVGLLFRPMRLPEAVWACLGALALILLHLISWDHTLLAVSKGIDVYLFLAGMMLLGELARWEGVFDWFTATFFSVEVCCTAASQRKSGRSGGSGCAFGGRKTCSLGFGDRDRFTPGCFDHRDFARPANLLGSSHSNSPRRAERSSSANLCGPGSLLERDPACRGPICDRRSSERCRTLRIAQSILEIVSRWPVFRGDLTGAFGVALISNLMNNLPVGLIGANALELAHIPAPMKNAFLIGVDLGPNLSVTGSLATILWLITLRKEGFRLTAWTFLKFGVLVMPLALVASVVALVLCSSAR